MKSRFSTVIISIVMILIVIIFIFFGIIIWNRVVTSSESAVESFKLNPTIAEEKNVVEQEVTKPEPIEDPLIGIITSSKVEEQTDEQNNDNEYEEQADYLNVVIDRYFYNQLEEYSKNIYKAFEFYKEDMKTGNYQIEFGKIFSPLLEQNDGKDELGKYYQSAIEAYTYDNPDIFYLSPNKMYLNIETITKGKSVKYNVYINSGNEANYLTDEFSSKEQIDNAINQIEEVKNTILMNKSNDTYRNIKMVHDYLIDNLYYDASISKKNIYDIYGALVNKICVCEGYARSFKYIMDAMRNTLYNGNRNGYKFTK